MEVAALRERGLEAFASGRYEEAAKTYTAAIKLVDTASDSHLASVLYSNRSAATCCIGMFVSSMVDAKLSLRMDPYWPKPYIRLANALCGMRRYSEALQALDEGLQACSSSAEAINGDGGHGVGEGTSSRPLDAADGTSNAALAELHAARDTMVDAAAAHARSQAARKRRRLAATAAAYGIALPGASPASLDQQAALAAAGQAKSGASGEDVLLLAVAILDAAAAARGWTPGRQPDDRRVPITCVSGFLGSGKTTLLAHLLRVMAGTTDPWPGPGEAEGHAGSGAAWGAALQSKRVAVIVNDLASVNVDADLLRSQMQPTAVTAPAQLAADDTRNHTAEVVELSNGCICCGLKGDMVVAVAKLLAQHPDVSYVLIEATGVGAPAPIAAALVATDSQGRGLEDYVRLDTCVTVVDTPRFTSLMNTSTSNAAGAGGEGLDPEDARPLAELLADQLEFADVILLNKVDAVQPSNSTPQNTSGVGSGGRLEEVEAVVRALNPRAKVLRAVRCAVDAAAVTNTHMFSMEAALHSARWQQELGSINDDSNHDKGAQGVQVTAAGAGGAANAVSTQEDGARPHKRVCLLLGKEEGDDHVPETEVYRINSVVYEARAPFHPGRLMSWLSSVAPLDSAEHVAAGASHRQPDLQPHSYSHTHAHAHDSGVCTGVVHGCEQQPHTGPHADAGQAGQAGQKHEEQQHASRTAPQPHQLPLPRVLRAKGFLWVASLPGVAWAWSVAGLSASIRPFGKWLASMLPPGAWPEPGTREGWDSRWGDRKQSLVVIGHQLDGAALRAALDACLLTQEELELGEGAWEGWEFGSWRAWVDEDEGGHLFGAPAQTPRVEQAPF